MKFRKKVVKQDWEDNDFMFRVYLTCEPQTNSPTFMSRHEKTNHLPTTTIFMLRLKKIDYLPSIFHGHKTRPKGVFSTGWQ